MRMARRMQKTAPMAMPALAAVERLELEEELDEELEEVVESAEEESGRWLAEGYVEKA